MSHSAWVERLQALVARATRYPLEMLSEDASLEDELGIDSIKLVEIVALAREELGIPKERTFKRDEVKTIGAIARALEASLPPAAAPLGSTAAVVPIRTAAPVLSAVAPAPAAAVSASPREARASTLAGKIILVTGSGRGLGRTLALALAAEGATVIVNSFHSRDAGDATCADIVQAGGRATHLWGSVANEGHVARIFEDIGQRFGRLDGLVANASDGFIGPFEELTPAHWQRGFHTNVVGLQLCAVAAAQLMRGGGQIVTMSTVTSNRYLRDFTCQGVLKAAVESLTRYLAVELAPRDVRVNCISAGPVDGELLHRFPDAEARIAHWTQVTPTGTLTDPGEVARLVGFLLSGALRTTTGSILTVDGGMSLSIDGRVGASAAAERPLDRRTGTAV